jgi:transcriptional regulator with XRE-family HTH domain
MRLRYARKLRGLTQEELEAKTGVSQSAISDLEKGESKSPSGTNLVTLAQKLEVNPDWLATGKGDMEQIDVPLSPRAIQVAKDWLRLAPEIQDSIEDMIRKMVKTSSADKEAAPNEKVAEAYGKPGKSRPSRK